MNKLWHKLSPQDYWWASTLAILLGISFYQAVAQEPKWLADLVAALSGWSLVALVIITAVYAKHTHGVQKATRELAKETHEQSLAALEPMLWFVYSGSTLEADLIHGPTVCDSLDLINVGRGPAINIHWGLWARSDPKTLEISASAFRVLLPAERSEEEVKPLFKCPSDGRMTLECVYQDVKSNWYSTIVPIEVSVEHQEGRLGRASIRGLDHITWKPLLSGEGKKLHERYHADTKE